MKLSGRWAHLQAVLFDLDGTLIDSAADLAAAANAMRADRGLQALPLTQYRPHGGSGARGMLSQAFGVAPGHATYDELRREFLDRYELLMHDSTRLFDGIEAELGALAEAGLAWGVVTNKAERFALPLVAALGLRAAAVVGGDTTAHTKPHPAPLLEAARRLGVAPAACLYVGDDERDILAGRAAGMATAVAAWGYLGQQGEFRHWQADLELAVPGVLLKHLGLA
ncbi:phosphoglycolate phosphatase [Roseateles saccharophilus]|uniref:phosphoglycolate phosphatase n=1 Tax=Roseateles saccharophilus TaxID=304 RepID=A0A4R3V9R2_ROSSA|nr:phosphoglycolate phosphatase [Roseateles saccharophilus]MDG0835300.1 phosphoglycolate phosphatase [Roseateles saccharophilus]TCV00272.1 phosphoglycolate phosphatase [Roseateles saccharophilus]